MIRLKLGILMLFLLILLSPMLIITFRLYLLRVCVSIPSVLIPSVLYPFSALTLLVGRQKGIWPEKSEWWVAGMVICLE